MVASLDDALDCISGEVAFVCGVVIHVEHTVRITVDRHHRDVLVGHICRCVCSEQKQSVEIGDRSILGCHGAAQGVSADDPVRDLRVRFLYILRRVGVEHSQTEGHLHEGTEIALFRKALHQRRISCILDLTARIENDSRIRSITAKCI